MVINGADPSVTGCTPLRLAISRQDIEFVGLISKSTFFSKCHEQYKLAISDASGTTDNGINLEIIKKLFETGQILYKQLDHALNSAVSVGNLNIVKFLVSKRLQIHMNRDDPEFSNDNESYSKFLKSAIDHLPIFRWIIENVPNFDIYYDFFLLEASKRDSYDVVAYILQKDPQNINKHTLLLKVYMFGEDLEYQVFLKWILILKYSSLYHYHQ